MGLSISSCSDATGVPVSTSEISSLGSEVPAEEMLWRMHFTIGAMAHTLAGASLLKLISGGMCDTTDMAKVERQMVAYTAAGLRAEVPKL